MTFLAFKLFICLFIVPVTFSAKILGFYPVPSISHQVVFRPVMLELAKRGHQVTVVTTDPILKNSETLENYTEIDVHDISYSMWTETILKIINGKTTNAEVIAVMLELIIDILDEQINTKEVQNLIKGNTKFDLIFVDACVRSNLIFGHVFKAPLIQFSSFGPAFPTHLIHGGTTSPLLLGEVLRYKLVNMTAWEKIQNMYVEMDHRNTILALADKENAMFKKNFGANSPSIDELDNVPDMLFLNINQIFGGNLPVPPGIIHLGGLHIKPLKPLPEELQSYLENSKNGVIYISFGTNVDTNQLSPKVVQTICRVFSRLPYNVIWKWNADELEGRPGNVKISKWLPQVDLLRHPNIKLFITQGGLQSTDEAIEAAVPLLTVPMLAEQWFNAENHVRLGIGVKLELYEIDDKSFETAINKVIGDPSYRQNIKKLRDVVNDQPQTSLERAVWWSEYVLRHGGAKHLRSPMANITWTDFLIPDVLAVLLTILIVCLLIFFIVVKVVLLLCFGRGRKVKRS